MVIFMIVVGPIYWKLRNGTEFILDEQLLWIFIGVIAVMNIPSILIYLNYYLQNRKTKFTLDTELKRISITHNGITKQYGNDEIEKSTYHLAIYYKNAIDRAGRMPMMISDFGYWDLQFKNGDRYYMTNILHNFIHDTPKVYNTKYRFRFFPFIIKADPKEALKLKEQREKTQTEKFVKQFKNKTDTQLNEILKNERKYQREAVEAARILLGKKNVG
ncbi:hypothetical protein BD809_10360 [Aquimarina intermedia]|uniref:PH domain-containing protein n=2 Tax=Aquimarina intermedia TaxID=350814 RepID=A0A5S5C8Q8_9FLAO|nr:hypothetical protein BD809_10360 [Aquimarina intermedia]